MTYHDEVVSFDCAGESLVGVLSVPDRRADTAVVIIVGGPQYRIGSHRQFVQLARTLAEAGFVAMRFDYRGMGDSTGNAIDFEHCTDDVHAALDALQARCTQVRRIVLCGLCDGASAALLYVGAKGDSRVSGLLLLNPWVRSAVSLARTHVKHYYLQRLGQREFWSKFFAGKLSRDALAELTRAVWNTSKPRSKRSTASDPYSTAFQQRMGKALAGYSKPAAVVLSGDDYTAKEFNEYAAADAVWISALSRPNVRQLTVDSADHTFSSTAARQAVESLVLNWLETNAFQVREVAVA